MLDHIGRSKCQPKVKHLQPERRHPQPAKPPGPLQRVTQLSPPQVLDLIKRARLAREAAETELAVLEPGLVGPGDAAGGDLLTDMPGELIQAPGRAGGRRRDRPGGQRDAEQLGQRLRGAVLGQELPGVQVDDDRGDPRPVLHRRLRPRRAVALVRYPQPHSRSISWCSVTSARTGCRSKTWRRFTAVTGRSASPVPHRPQQAGSWRISRSGLAACFSVAPLCPSCPPGLRPLRLRSDRGLGAGLASPSLDGGLEEFRGFWFSRASSPAIRPRAPASSVRAWASTPAISQVTRLSVLNTSADSLGINQRARYSIDQFASSTAVPYSTIRPAIFSASLLAAADEVRALRTWTGLAGSGRMALIDHRDAAEAGLRVLTDPALRGAHHDLTGPVPMSWPEALELLSAELGEPVTFRVAAERQFLERLTGAGLPAGTAELLITREWAILAGENDYTTGTFQQITGRPPRPVAEFLHEYRAEFA